MKKNSLWSNNMWKVDDEVGCHNCGWYWNSDGIGCHAPGKRFTSGYCDYFEQNHKLVIDSQSEYEAYVEIWN